MEKKFISWRRVSTTKQRGSHLGLEAQKSIIDYFVEREKGVLLADYEECHSGTDLAGCVELKKAKKHCKVTGATLIIAKTDRCRDTIEALQLYEEMKGNIYFCDLPSTDKFTLTLFFSLAEREAMIVSLRTKQALQALKERGNVKFGAASPTYRENYENKSQDEKNEIKKKRARSKNEGYLSNKNVRAFLRVLKNVFPDACKEDDVCKWKWNFIHNDGEYRDKIIHFLIDYNAMDGTGTLFENWKFSEWKDDKSRRVKMVSRILFSVKKSVNNHIKNN